VWDSDRSQRQQAHKLRFSVLVSLLSTLGALAHAQGTVTEADLERARRTTPRITDADLERARRANPMPSDKELSRIPIPSVPNVDALPQPTQQRAMDLGALAKGYESAIGSQMPSGPFGGGPALLIFVSFAMPEASLSRLVDQASRAGGVIVIRGLVHGSLKETVQRAQALIGQRRVGFQIDPQAFDRFSVAATPTFVLVKDGAQTAPCAAGTCFDRAGFVSATGDVSLRYALEYFEQRAPAFASDASGFIKRLGGSM
jgi:conjugal transfer pilus assembly protein TrbC